MSEEEGFESESGIAIEPEDIASDKMTLPYLILRQLDRINLLLSQTGNWAFPGKNNRSAVHFAIGALESMCANHLDEKYFDKIRELEKASLKRAYKRNEDGFEADFAFLNFSLKRYALLIQELAKTNLIPKQQKSLKF